MILSRMLILVAAILCTSSLELEEPKLEKLEQEVDEEGNSVHRYLGQYMIESLDEWSAGWLSLLSGYEFKSSHQIGTCWMTYLWHLLNVKIHCCLKRPNLKEAWIAYFLSYNFLPNLLAVPKLNKAMCTNATIGKTKQDIPFLICLKLWQHQLLALRHWPMWRHRLTCTRLSEETKCGRANIRSSLASGRPPARGRIAEGP